MFLAVNLLFYCMKASFEKNERSSVVKAVDFHQSNPGFESRFISCRSLVASGRGSDQSCSHGLDKYHLWLALFCIAKPLQFQAVVHENQLKGPVKEPNMFHSYEIEKITRKALTCFTVRGRKPTIISSCSVLPPEFGSSTRDRHARRIYRYASCMKISGGRTEQHVKIGFGELAAVD